MRSILRSRWFERKLACTKEEGAALVGSPWWLMGAIGILEPLREGATKEMLPKIGLSYEGKF